MRECRSCGADLTGRPPRRVYCSSTCFNVSSRRSSGVEYDGLWFANTPPNRYYWNKSQEHGTRSLHKYIWEKHNGPTPAGFQIHHVDGDASNNTLGNLTAVDAREHARHHLLERIASGELDVESSLAKAREAAKQWHGSDAGREWHSEHGKRSWAGRELSAHACAHCGRDYEVKRGARKRGFCSPSCQTAARVKSGVDNETRRCSICAAEFVCNKYTRKKTCSKACWKAAVAESHRRLHAAGGE